MPGQRNIHTYMYVYILDIHQAKYECPNLTYVHTYACKEMGVLPRVVL